MKKTLKAFAVAAVVGLVAGVATAGPKLRPDAARFELAGCDGGISAVITPGGSYVMSVINETTWLCVNDAGCDKAGHPFAASLSMNMDFDDKSVVSCRSVSMTGDITFTFKAPGT